MNKKTFLAGKTFRLTEDQQDKIFDLLGAGTMQYIQFESMMLTSHPAFNLYDKNFELLFCGEEEEDPDYLLEMFEDQAPVNDFYKKKVKSNKKGQPNMSFSAILKKAISKDIKAMCDLGYLDSDLRLTESGTDWLLAELLDMNKDELGAAAQVELADKKKKKKSK